MPLENTVRTARHLLNRLAYGPRPGEVAQVVEQGVDGWLAGQLAPETEAEGLLFEKLAPLITLGMSWEELVAHLHKEAWEDQVRPLTELGHATILRARYSERQLVERMTEFWRDHFNVFCYIDGGPQLYGAWDALLRGHALGNFHQMLRAVAQHPLMLVYLDNHISTDAGPNENFARELLELHTLGGMHYRKDGGYVDDDVYEASRCFTGWSVEYDRERPDFGVFRYRHENHDRFQKLFLGAPISRDQEGMKDGFDVLERLAGHDATARHIAHKLCVFFVADEPREALVSATARVFQANVHDERQIQKTLEYIFHSEDFVRASGVKFKRPFDWFISAMRAMDLDYVPPAQFPLGWMFQMMGQPLFAWLTPDGPPHDSRHWVSAGGLMHRWRAAGALVNGWYKDIGLTYEPAAVDLSGVRTARDAAMFWSQRMMGEELGLPTLAALIDFVAAGRNADVPLPEQHLTAKHAHVAALCMMTPEFMRR